MKDISILIIDDEVSNQYLLEGLLSVNGYKPLLASGGEECFEILKQHTPDLILLDIMMPVMNGLEVLEKLMQNDTWKNIPVIIVSAKTASSDVQEALEKGAVDYIKKPFDEMELIARVRVGIRLKENEDKLREMVRLRNEFVKIISHDLRSPFTTIQGFAELLAKADNLTEDQKNTLSYIVKSVEFSDNYFNKLLSWTMIDHGDLKLERSDIRIHELVDNVITVFKSKAAAKHQKILNQIDPDLQINADGTFLHQALANLLSNAVKFTPEGGEVRFFDKRDKKGPALVISDTGIGMPVNVSSEALFKDTLISTRKGTVGEKGTGIGLSICKKILDAHKYDLDFQVNEKGGTDFRIRFYLSGKPA